MKFERRAARFSPKLIYLALCNRLSALILEGRRRLALSNFKLLSNQSENDASYKRESTSARLTANSATLPTGDISTRCSLSKVNGAIISKESTGQRAPGSLEDSPRYRVYWISAKVRISSLGWLYSNKWVATLYNRCAVNRR